MGYGPPRTATMTTSDTWKRQILSFSELVDTLADQCERVAIRPPDDDAWTELLRRRLVPDLETGVPYLVVAIVGGTNIGKSLIFNHLAGENASGVSHRAAGTRHPVCLVPESADASVVSRIFRDFQAVPWTTPDQALDETDDYRLFWKSSAQIPDRLILIDTPDVDSTATINWPRAEAIRSAADVLIAVLTQQKYNDAAMKRFFREAAMADKSVILVFNMVDPVGDRDWWDDWITTFREETGVVAESIWIVPHDREAAARQRLPFLKLTKNVQRAPESVPDDSDTHESPDSVEGGVSSVGRRSGNGSGGGFLVRHTPESASLTGELGDLRFDSVRLRTFRGAIRRIVDSREGAPAWLAKLRQAASRYQRAVKTLQADQLVRIEWPNLPPEIVSEEIWRWWNLSRPVWVRRVHGFYRNVSRGIFRGVRGTWHYLKGDELTTGSGPTDSLTVFRNQERNAIQSAIERLYAELQRLAEVGEETLRNQVATVLSGASRGDVLRRMEETYESLPTVDDDFRRFIAERMEQWRKTSRNVDKVLRYTDYTAAILRPAVSVGLFVTGSQLAGHIAGSALFHAAQDTLIGTATTVVGDAAISAGGDLTGQVATFFLSIQEHYVEQRAKWLAGRLEEELLGDLLETLRRGARIGDSPELNEAESLLRKFRTQLDEENAVAAH
ncbi:MAG: 50S ribosome-binding GTPase [Planctomycetia bacterium]|nr:50S ribosome-binding GTPase [Planctomycetia bacterium]